MLTLKILSTIFIGISFMWMAVKTRYTWEEYKPGLFIDLILSVLWRAFIIVTLWVK